MALGSLFLACRGAVAAGAGVWVADAVGFIVGILVGEDVGKYVKAYWRRRNAAIC